MPVPLSTVFATPTLLLTNIMACRVYRNTRFGLFRADDISTANMTRDMPVFNQTQQTGEGSTRGTRHVGGVEISLKSPQLSQREKENRDTAKSRDDLESTADPEKVGC